MSQVLIALEGFGVKFQIRDPEMGETGVYKKTKVGGFDKRKERFTGYVEIESFSWNGGENHGSFCVMRREKVGLYTPFRLFHCRYMLLLQGNPISWRQLWKALITAAEVEPLVLKRR